MHASLMAVSSLRIRGTLYKELHVFQTRHVTYLVVINNRKRREKRRSPTANSEFQDSGSYLGISLRHALLHNEDLLITIKFETRIDSYANRCV